MEQQLNSSTGFWANDDRRDEDDFKHLSQTDAKPIVIRSVCSLKYDHYFLKGTGISECPECGESFLQTDV